MNAAEHRAEADRLLVMVDRNVNPEWARDWGAQTLASAQVHATLAHAAAAIDAAADRLLLLDALEKLRSRGGVAAYVRGEWQEYRAELIPSTVRAPGDGDVAVVTIDSIIELLQAVAIK